MLDNTWTAAAFNLPTTLREHVAVTIANMPPMIVFGGYTGSTTVTNKVYVRSDFTATGSWLTYTAPWSPRTNAAGMSVGVSVVMCCGKKSDGTLTGDSWITADCKI